MSTVSCSPCPPRTKRPLLNTRKMAQLFKVHGAVEVVECWGDDVPEGKLAPMPMGNVAQA